MKRNEILDQLVVEAFNLLAFIPVAHSTPRDDFHGTVVRVELGSGTPAELILCLSNEVIEEIVSSAMGESARCSDRKVQEDVLGELGNVIAGRYLADKADSVELGLPRVEYDGQVHHALHGYQTHAGELWATIAHGGP